MVRQRVMESFEANPLALRILEGDGTYSGWVTTMHGGTLDGAPVSWDLGRRDHRFGLYLLASTWSRTGRWESGARLAVALNAEPERFLNPRTWVDADNAGAAFSDLRVIAATRASLPRGRPVAIRSDCQQSFFAVSVNADFIEATVADVRDGRTDTATAFRQLRRITGTAARGNRWNVKIPLIFRELRCQGWSRIAGESCCVPDVRVRATYRELHRPLPVGVLAASRVVYSDFGDLYDIPAFLYLYPSEGSRLAGAARNRPRPTERPIQALRSAI